MGREAELVCPLPVPGMKPEPHKEINAVTLHNQRGFKLRAVYYAVHKLVLKYTKVNKNS